MKSLKDLQNKINEINKLIKKNIISDNQDTQPITDGIIDIKRYFNAKYKILWILKEPYDEFDENGNPFGGGWSLSELIKSKKTIRDFSGGKPTFKPMIYSSWGILNDFCLWNDMDDVEDAPSMLDALKSTAYINIKKLPGRTSSYQPVIEKTYLQHKDILLKQIEYYEPDIIIGGSTLGIICNDLGFTKSEMKKYESVNYILKDNKIFIDAYHPAQRSWNTDVSKEKYCNNLITVVKKYFSSN